MKEYIERNALIAEFKRLTLGENSLVERLFADGVYAVIETFPVADVVEARHGRWETAPCNGVYDMRCSACGFAPGIRFYSSDYCPNCGACMDKEDEIYG